MTPFMFHSTENFHSISDNIHHLYWFQLKWILMSSCYYCHIYEQIQALWTADTRKVRFVFSTIVHRNHEIVTPDYTARWMDTSSTLPHNYNNSVCICESLWIDVKRVYDMPHLMNSKTLKHRNWAEKKNPINSCFYISLYN